MKSVDILKDEHENIKEMLGVIQAMAKEAIRTQNINTDHFRMVSDFIKNYADGYHHGKEEDILFKNMVEYSGRAGRVLVEHGMLVEHDLARYHNNSLLSALDLYDDAPGLDNLIQVLTHALSYRDLLQKHIDKENTAAFSLAERSLPEEVVEENEKDFARFNEENIHIKEKYLNILKQLKEIYY